MIISINLIRQQFIAIFAEKVIHHNKVTFMITIIILDEYVLVLILFFRQV